MSTLCVGMTTRRAGMGNAGCGAIGGAGDVGGVEFLNGLSKSSLSGESERSRLEGVLGVRDDVRVLRLDDATERAMKRPLVLGCVCQLRLKTW